MGNPKPLLNDIMVAICQRFPAFLTFEWHLNVKIVCPVPESYRVSVEGFMKFCDFLSISDFRFVSESSIQLILFEYKDDHLVQSCKEVLAYS